MILDVIVLIGLVKLLLETERWMLCAGLYTGLSFLLGLLIHGFSGELIVGTIILMGMSSLYFWLLQRLEGSGTVWWLVAIGGPMARVALACLAMAATSA